MLTGMMPNDPHDAMKLLWQRMQQHDTDIKRLWNHNTNRMWTNQTNQPGGASSISSSSSSSSSYTGDGDPPACPDGIPELCEDAGFGPGCCCHWTWYTAEGWVLTACSTLCLECHGDVIPCSTRCTTEPSGDGEYEGQRCFIVGDECGPPVDCLCGYCSWTSYDSGGGVPAWPGTPTVTACSGLGSCSAGPVTAPDYVGQIEYECCTGLGC